MKHDTTSVNPHGTEYDSTDGHSLGIGGDYQGLVDKTCTSCGYHTARYWTDGEVDKYECTDCGSESIDI